MSHCGRKLLTDKANPAKAHLVHLNRLLLEDTYPLELKRNTKEPLKKGPVDPDLQEFLEPFGPDPEPPTDMAALLEDSWGNPVGTMHERILH